MLITRIANMKKLSKLVYSDLSYKITGILCVAHNELGRFRNEKQYSDAIEKYLKIYKINYKREAELPISFDGEKKGRNKIDFLIDDKILLEIKVKFLLSNEDCRQLMRYLISSGKKLGLLVNFHQKYLQPKRILNSLVKE